MVATLAFVAVCSILAMHIPSPAESADSANGKADELFQLLERLDGNTPIYTTKRSFQRNLKADEKSTVQCVIAVKKFANNTAAELCTQYKTDKELGSPFLSTYTKMTETTIQGSSGSTQNMLTVQYVDPSGDCFIVSVNERTPSGNNKAACDMLSKSLTSTNSNCDTQFENLCGTQSQTISSTSGCSGVSNPTCQDPK
uniref:Putative secreted protein n=1 Tax=Ixodes ricinus TaxID=34613 RepID=A0A090XD19_IXORI